MSLLDQIDFYKHDGVNRAMINDFMRNQFYDSIFAGNVQDQHCVDIGFGTGLLSMLALKHGARSVVAYESDDARYELGKLIIERLELTAKIKLIHGRFYHPMLYQYPEVTVVFSETVGGNLWGEGLFNSLQRTHKVKFLPGQYFLEIYACVVPDSFAQGLINPTPNLGFSPGVDIDVNFVELINKLGFPTHSVPKSAWPVAQNNLLNFEVHNETDWGWMPYLRLAVNNGTIASAYTINANSITTAVANGATLPINFDSVEQKIVIDTNGWQDKSIILIPRAGMRHENHKLMLDTGSWGPTLDPVILTRPTGNVVVTHSFLSGIITYTNV